MTVILEMLTIGLIVYIGYQLILVGEQKLAGHPTLIDGFTLVGTHFNLDPHLFRRLIGILEIGLPFLLLTPTFRPLAACVLLCITGGAIYTHLVLFKDPRGWVPASKIFVALIPLLFL
jgi:uncharacterized membrane protein YphA (DoxX/SURF4 family)